MPPDAPRPLGSHRLRVDPDRVAAYARETGGDGGGVPLSFPAVWLTEPRIFDPVREVCAALDAVPVHEGQSFFYTRPLVAGESYDVAISMRREETPPRLIVDATIAAADGDSVGRIETTLRLVPRAGLGGAS
jgi:hypothetical protein